MGLIPSRFHLSANTGAMVVFIIIIFIVDSVHTALDSKDPVLKTEITTNVCLVTCLTRESSFSWLQHDIAYLHV